MTRVLVRGTKARIGVLVVALLLAAPAYAAVIRAGADANGRTIQVRTGDRLVVTLAANASTGYSWVAISSGAPVLRLESVRSVPPTTRRLGAPGTYVARFAVRAAGRATIRLAYVRHTTPATPAAKTFVLRVVATK